MNTHRLHPWNLRIEDAKRIQVELASRVIRKDVLKEIRTVAGVDVSVRGDAATAACVICSYPGLELLEYRAETSALTMPYIPGLLSFREIPALIPVLKKIRIKPDIFIADSQGIAHPRRFGLASHLGLVTDTPSIGCAKSRLVGNYVVPGGNRGDYEYLYADGEIVGAVVRTKDNVRPLFVSIGHKITLESAIGFVIGCCAGYRLTEPVRFAHRASRLEPL